MPTFSNVNLEESTSELIPAVGLSIIHTDGLVSWIASIIYQFVNIVSCAYLNEASTLSHE